MKILFTHPTGNSNVRAILKGFLENGMLDSFYTTLACYPDNIWDIMSRVNYFAEFRRREFDPSLKPFTHMHPFKELGRMCSSKLKLTGLIRHETGFFSVDAVYNDLDIEASKFLSKRKDIDAVYAYEDGALALFKEAKKKSIKCIYDLPIAYWETGRRLMIEEAQRLPLWSETVMAGIKDSQYKLERKSEELYLADTIVVASTFVKDSITEFATDKKIVLSPFGSPLTTSISPPKKSIKPLRVLFAGSMGQRKGLGDLFEAFKILNNRNIQLVVMGSLLAPLAFYKKEYDNFIYEPPRSNSKVLELMRSCDVFCLPSIVEGRALVMQEAMSQGLPLIITPNTGGEDLIIEGKTGFLVPIRSPYIIAERINWFLENRSELESMSQFAQLHARSYTWEKYSHTIINSISK